MGAVAALSAPGPANARDERAALRKTDPDFSAAAAALGIGEAFVRYADAEATSMPAGALPVTGREAIRRQFAVAPAGATLSWKPFRAEVSQGADLGYTLVTYEYRARGPAGKPDVRNGKYCSIWKKQPDGSWKWVVDIGNESPEPRP
jgi:ketosteroid isomerase-like protein